ncbi:hypothetical protein PHAVU_003G077900 [Phaseolus vulgaris]|uniref:Uncharacterized protein n=1 Tax=Phaseolus vulgaris TaxID=3885 RepID=V7C6X8_PHAVU|nr:hypothetical protein PHAVU_003G077900g [Phaseolus vulgaris]ESW25932.1 hypothetical protein PHAVU_003G077900g [Phaseolus vulgaris]
MGNCVQPASSMEWDGEDWSDLTSKKSSSSKVFDKAHADGKVKIKISKRELAELLEKKHQVNQKHVGRASAEQVLLRLIKARNDDGNHRLWMPTLESIPEVS